MTFELLSIHTQTDTHTRTRAQCSRWYEIYYRVHQFIDQYWISQTDRLYIYLLVYLTEQVTLFLFKYILYCYIFLSNMFERESKYQINKRFQQTSANMSSKSMCQ